MVLDFFLLVTFFFLLNLDGECDGDGWGWFACSEPPALSAPALHSSGSLWDFHPFHHHGEQGEGQMNTLLALNQPP